MSTLEEFNKTLNTLQSEVNSLSNVSQVYQKVEGLAQDHHALLEQMQRATDALHDATNALLTHSARLDDAKKEFAQQFKSLRTLMCVLAAATVVLIALITFLFIA